MRIATNTNNMPPNRRTCTRCGTLGHLAKTCERFEKAYHMVGIEIEGYWRDARWDEVKADARAHGATGSGDGSLNEHADYTTYEWKTKPGSIGEAINQLVDLYPDATDDKCGMHIHVSFERSDVVALASEEFFAYFREQWEAWGREMEIKPDSQFWKRLRGENQYCRVNTIASWRLGHAVDSLDEEGREDIAWCVDAKCTRTQCVSRREARKAQRFHPDCYPHANNLISRYYQLNFISLAVHGTVECRLLPMFRDARLGVLAVEKLISIYETFLAESDERVYAKASTKTAVVLPGPMSTLRSDVKVQMPELPGPEPEAMALSAPLYELSEVLPGFVRVPLAIAHEALGRALSAQGVC